MFATSEDYQPVVAGDQSGASLGRSRAREGDPATRAILDSLPVLEKLRSLSRAGSNRDTDTGSLSGALSEQVQRLLHCHLYISHPRTSRTGTAWPRVWLPAV